MAWSIPMHHRAGAIMATTAALAALALAGCQTTGEPQTGAAPPSAASERGRAFAERECASCHAIGLNTVSPRSSAPPFVALRGRNNRLSFERRMGEIAEGEHSDMRAIALEPGQIQDVSAYIESLEPR